MAKFRQAKLKKDSQRITVRLPLETYNKTTLASSERGLSINNYIVLILEKHSENVGRENKR